MNHFAHLVLGQPTVASAVGNLLGDFARGVDLRDLDPAVRAGLDNHRAVDRFTDSHPRVVELKTGFSRERRRFAGIALDLYFDHLLIRHWDRFYDHDVDATIDGFYRRMRQGRDLMPSQSMRDITARIIDYDWFGSYRDRDNIAESMNRVAARIRFRHRFDDAIEDIERLEPAVGQVFLEFFPQLRQHIRELGLETQ